MRVNGGDFPRRGGADMGKHRQRNIEVIVGVRAPGQPPFVAHLSDADRALHGPEVRIGQGNIHGLHLDRVPHLAPVGGDHVGGGRQAGGAAEFGHDFPSGVTVLGAAGIFGVGQHMLLSRQRRMASSKDQAPLGSMVMRASGKRSASAVDGLDLLFAAEHAALQLEVIKAVAGMGGFGQPHDRLRRQRFFVTQTQPVVFRVGRVQVGQDRSSCGLRRRTDSRASPPLALLTFPEQRGNRHTQELPQADPAVRLQWR